tara:strand:- start:23 stop:3127 length:3105 start_codon:yes stop_codon:yes gene_type:complete
MFDRTQIDPRVQKQLFRKIDSINRRELGGDDSPFFVGNALDVSTKNPASEHLFRSCFAKVSVAVPNMETDESGKSTLVHQPISLSSYMNGQEDDEILGTKDNAKNTPLTFSQGVNENEKNRFRGHSGITKISVAQQKYYTYKYTIDWTCPDPIYFEKVFEPNFLRLGSYMAIEFGWGIEDSEIKDVEPLTIEEMIRFLTPNEEQPEKGGGQALYERNLKTAGNYFCGVGTVMKFDWKIGSDGTYSGNIEVITPGISALTETTQTTSNSSDSIPEIKLKNSIVLKRLSEKILKNESKYDVTEEDRENLRRAQRDSGEIAEQLKVNSATFNVCMRNLDKVADYFLDDKEDDRTITKFGYSDYSDVFIRDSNQIGFGKEVMGQVDYKYQDRLLRLKAKETGGVKVKDSMKKRYFASWGWFEDNILNNFFELKSGDMLLQTFRSSQIQPFRKTNAGQTQLNRCVSGPHLYSLGLDYTILPNQHHPLLKDGFSKFNPDEKKLIPDYYPREQRYNLDRIRLVYEVIDKHFPEFFAGYDDDRVITRPTNLVEKNPKREILHKGEYGHIRNMVFPLEMFQKHFQNTPSTRQGIRNFWADVNNQYGGYWGFQIGASNLNPNVVGVFDSYYSPKNLSSQSKLSSVDDEDGMFTFSIYSKDSIVKSFDVNLKLSAEAATIARSGHFTRPQSGTTKVDGKKELGIEAWNILNRDIDEEEVQNLEELKEFRKLYKKSLKSISFKGDDLQTNFLEKIKNLTEDDKKIFETLENSRTKFIQGVGAYDDRGNFSSYFKSIMLHLINFSDMKGSGSNIELSQPQLPIEVSLTLDGIGGLSVGNLFKVDYLPKVYREFCYFMITKVEHNVGTSGWETSLSGRMIADLPTYWQKSGRKLNSGLESYEDLFRLTNVPIDAFGQEQEVGQAESSQYNIYKNTKENITTFYNKSKLLQNGNSGEYDSQSAGLANRFITFENAYLKLKDTLTVLNKTNDIQTIDADYIERRDEVENILSQQKIPYTLKTPLDAIRTKEADKEAGKELLEKRGGAFGY